MKRLMFLSMSLLVSYCILSMEKSSSSDISTTSGGYEFSTSHTDDVIWDSHNTTDTTTTTTTSSYDTAVNWEPVSTPNLDNLGK